MFLFPRRLCVNILCRHTMFLAVMNRTLHPQWLVYCCPDSATVCAGDNWLTYWLVKHFKPCIRPETTESEKLQVFLFFFIWPHTIMCCFAHCVLLTTRMLFLCLMSYYHDYTHNGHILSSFRNTWWDITSVVLEISSLQNSEVAQNYKNMVSSYLSLGLYNFHF